MVDSKGERRRAPRPGGLEAHETEVLVIACGFGEYLRAMAEYNEDVIVRGYLARSDQGRHLSSLKSASRLAKGLTAAGVGIASIAIIGLYWN